jgi:hypothetical protein
VSQGCWWILGVVVALAIVTTVISEVRKSWHLKGLSPSQRRIVELKLASYQILRSQVNITNEELVRGQRTIGEHDAEIHELFATMDEAQKNALHNAYAKLSWRFTVLCG